MHDECPYACTAKALLIALLANDDVQNAAQKECHQSSFPECDGRCVGLQSCSKWIGTHDRGCQCCKCLQVNVNVQHFMASCV